jgi:hypothetical protein
MARVLSLSRCPSLAARVELSRAPLMLEHIKNAPYQVTPSTWYGAFSISYLSLNDASEQFNFAVLVQRPSDNLHPGIVHVEIITDHRQRRPRSVHTVIEEPKPDLIVRKLGHVHLPGAPAKEQCAYLSIHTDTVNDRVRHHCAA